MDKMKKKYIISAVLVLTLCPVSCNWVDDLEPSQSISNSSVWGSQDAVDHLVYGLYAYIKNAAEISNYNQAAYTDAYADLLKSGSWSAGDNSYNKTMMEEGSFSSTNAGAFECWTNNYSYIRRCNEFLRDAEVYGSSFKEPVVKSWCAEVRFIRAMAYTMLMLVYGNDDPSFKNGGVVIRSKLEGPEANNKQRSTWDECWNFIIEDLEYAAENLPESSIEGRLKKAAAWGYLSRVAVYAKQWNKAVSAAEACEEHGGELVPSYRTAIHTSSCAEVLLPVCFTEKGTITHRAESFFRPLGDGAYHGNVSMASNIGPTSEFADEFEMADGSAFVWADHSTDPFTGREPRFYENILYNGAAWEGRTIELYTGGADEWSTFACSGTTKSTPTGYYFKKFLIEDATSWQLYGSSHFGAIIRFSEVLINKAEALCMLGEMDKACTALNRVRSRVGLPGRSTADKDEFMSFVRHEKIVELGGEGLRFWDLRRWKLAEDTINGQCLHGLEIAKNDDGTFTYKRVSVDADRTRVFPERYYAFSLPEDERNNNTELGENNPGW